MDLRLFIAAKKKTVSSRDSTPVQQSKDFPDVDTYITCKEKERDSCSSRGLNWEKVKSGEQETLSQKHRRNTDALVQSLRKRVADLKREVQLVMSKAKQSAEAAVESSINARKLSQKLAKVERDYRVSTQDLIDENKQVFVAFRQRPAFREQGRDCSLKSDTKTKTATF